jgi:probable F420-dependent oxidoreductase
MLDVVVCMGAIAARTSRIRMASSVHIAPYRHPLSSAHQFATADVLSNGRVIVGVGSGWDPEEFAAVGASFEHRGAVAEECIEIYKKAWTQPWLEHRGRFFTIESVSLEPKPAQQPHPPIVFGAVTPAGARRAARSADGLYPMFLDAYADPSRFDHLRETVLEEAERVGRDLTGFRLYAFASGLVVDADDELARRERRPTLTGTAEQVIGDLERFAAAGYSHVTMHFHVRSGTIAELFEIAERFAEEVLPAAKEIEATPIA